MGLNRLSWLMVQKVIELLAFLEKYVNIKPKSSQVSAVEKNQHHSCILLLFSSFPDLLHLGFVRDTLCSRICMVVQWAS